jgi:flagellar biosynthetic protein FliQ
MMDQGTVLDIGREALLVAATIAGPMLLVALVVGLLIGIVQAATSINEMTLSFIPKLVALVLVLYLFGSWQITVLTDFASSLIQRIPGIVG